MEFQALKFAEFLKRLIFVFLIFLFFSENKIKHVYIRALENGNGILFNEFPKHCVNQ